MTVYQAGSWTEGPDWSTSAVLCSEGGSVVFQSDTEFWDKMQAEWEELARRNWLEESEDQGPIPTTVSPAEKVSLDAGPTNSDPSTLWSVLLFF